MGFFDPAWMTKKDRKRAQAIAAVGQIDDQTELARIAHEAPLLDVCIAAINRMQDQDALYAMAVNSQASVITTAIVKRLDDAHLVRFASRKPLMKYTGMHYGADEERLAIELIQSEEAVADLFLAFGMQGRTHPSAGGIVGDAVRKRMGEAECAAAVRRLQARGMQVDPAGFLGSRIQSAETRRELGLDLDKDELVARFAQDPDGNKARTLWPLLDDDEKRDMQQRATAYLCDGSMLDPVRFAGLADYLDDPACLQRLLFANPNHEKNLMLIIAKVDDPGTLRAFLQMLDGREMHNTPDYLGHRTPEPSDRDYIIHTSEANDHRVKTRLPDAVRWRIAELERGAR